MKIIRCYKCDVCGSVYETERNAKHCEASDYGLTDEEYDKWGKLKDAAESAGKVVGCVKNANTDAEFDRAIKELTDFEVQHNLPDGISC